MKRKRSSGSGNGIKSGSNVALKDVILTTGKRDIVKSRSVEGEEILKALWSLTAECDDHRQFSRNKEAEKRPWIAVQARRHVLVFSVKGKGAVR